MKRYEPDIDYSDRDALPTMRESASGAYRLASEAQAEIERLTAECEYRREEYVSAIKSAGKMRDDFQAEIERLRRNMSDCVGYFEDLIKCARHFASRNTSAPFQAHELCDAIAEAEDILTGLNATLTPPTGKDQ